MKTKLHILLNFIGLFTFAQEPPMPPMVFDKIKTREEIWECGCGMEAHFPGGMYWLHDYLQKKLDQAPNLQDFPSGETINYVQFLIDENGLIYLEKIYQRPYNSEVEKFLIDLMEHMPPWIPDESGCEYRESRVRIPIRIVIY